MAIDNKKNDSKSIKKQRNSYMFSIVTEDIADREFKDYLLNELDIDPEQCIWVPKNYDTEDVLLNLENDLKECNSNCIIFAFCESIPKDISSQYIEIKEEITEDIKNKVEDIAIQDFPHLHLHDEYSLRDGLGTAQQRVDLMQERGWTYLTATNHGSLGGWIKQYSLAKKLGLKAIFGIEAYLNSYRNLPRETYKDMDDDMKIKYRRNNHQILLARNMEGWFNIIKIQNDAELNGFYYVPRTDPDFLMQHGKGIIGTSTDGGAGEIPNILMDESLEWEQRLELAKAKYEFYCDAFDDYYLEINLIDWDRQIHINRALITFGEWVGAKYVITTDVHYLREEDSAAHDVLLMIRDNKTMVDKALGIAAQHMAPLLEKAGFATDIKSEEWRAENDNEDKQKIIQEALSFGRKFLEENNYQECIKKYDESAERIGKGEQEKALKEDAVWEFEIKDFYFKTVDDLYNSWDKMHGKEDEVFTEDVFWRAIRDTRQLARSIENFEIDTSVKLPKMAENSLEELKKITRQGMDRLGFTGKEEYENRLNEEFRVIEKLDFADYFLIFRKIVEYCKEEKIYYGPGRGSSAGCLIAYCLEITKLDPLRHGLLFERFLDEERSDPPDIDWDVDPRYRQQVKNQMANIFGEDNVCSVGSYQLIWTKTAIKDVGRVFGLEPSFLNGITKGLADSYLSEAEGEISSLDKMDWHDLIEQEPTISSLIKNYPYMSDACRLLRGQIRNIGKHPAGMIVSSVNLTEWIPLRRIGSKDESEVVACWTEGLALKELQEIGLVKYDVLGLRTISIIADAVGLIEQTTIVINLENNQKVRLKEDDIVEVEWEGEILETTAKDLEPGHVLVGIPDSAIIY